MITPSIAKQRTSLDDYCQPKYVPDFFPHLFTKGQWEWAYRNRKTNGLHRAVHYLGGRHLVNIRTLAALLEQNVEPADE